MALNNLINTKGARKKRKRLGRGPGSGRGGTSGRGHKGQKARSGGSTRPGFEGGQTPLYMRVPKRGFSNIRFKKIYTIVNLSQLNRFEEGTTITPELLKEKGVIKKLNDGVKILGDGELKVKLNINAHKFSQSARTKIEQANGTWKVIE